MQSTGSYWYYVYVLLFFSWTKLCPSGFNDKTIQRYEQTQTYCSNQLFTHKYNIFSKEQLTNLIDIRDMASEDCLPHHPARMYKIRQHFLRSSRLLTSFSPLYQTLNHPHHQWTFSLTSTTFSSTPLLRVMYPPTQTAEAPAATPPPAVSLHEMSHSS